MKRRDKNPGHAAELVLTASQMAAVDRFAIDQIGIPGTVLMENAGRKVVETIVSEFGNPSGRRVAVVCGKGNNGGDGYVVARALRNLGADVKIFTTSDPAESVGDAALNFRILTNLGVSTSMCDSKDFAAALANAELIVDAILGAGITGPLRGRIAETVRAINDSAAPVVSIDLPTGVETDTGAIQGECVKARHTVTMGHLKRGLLFSPGREFAGDARLADIGFPPEASQSVGATCFRTSPEQVEALLPRRAANTFKNRRGKVLVLAGSVGMTGAAALAAEATLRAGAGLTILGIPESLNPILEQKLTEVMTLPLPETAGQTLSVAAKEKIAGRLAWADVVALGPGLSAHEDCAELVYWLLDEFEKTIILDADALNCLAGTPDRIRKAKGDLLLTPHAGELARLTGQTAAAIAAAPILSAEEAARQFQATVALKGGPTVTATVEGNIYINPTGNAGMATAGMGDVLSGVVAGLAAQGLSPSDAAIAGVYVHGLAGDLAKETVGEAGLVARDVLAQLPAAIKHFEKDRARTFEST